MVCNLIAINHGNKLESHYNEIYPPELILKKENFSHTCTTFLELHLYINKGQIQTSLFDKRNSYNFNAVTLSFKSIIILSKVFFATTSACPSVVQYIKIFKVFLHEMLSFN